MKKLFFILCIVLPLMYSPVQAKQHAKTTVVCDLKQKCKTVKLHKKLTGTKVPQQAKKKK